MTIGIVVVIILALAVMVVIATALLSVAAPKTDSEKAKEDKEQIEYLIKWRREENRKVDRVHNRSMKAFVHMVESLKLLKKKGK